ncbi:hypothetical protein BV20DRAFT_37314 [Pilatotrama ljubarskyi]|nr:hypothetical protein BV20DRAFT_37314 [Pilatotrama ljubarskyi]
MSFQTEELSDERSKRVADEGPCRAQYAKTPRCRGHITLTLRSRARNVAAKKAVKRNVTFLASAAHAHERCQASRLHSLDMFGQIFHCHRSVIAAQGAERRCCCRVGWYHAYCKILRGAARLLDLYIRNHASCGLKCAVTDADSKATKFVAEFLSGPRSITPEYPMLDFVPLAEGIAVCTP